MPLIIQQGPGGPRDFTLGVAPGGLPLTPEETDCAGRVNGQVADLSAIADDGTPRGKELTEERDACLNRLRASANKHVGGAVTAQELFANSFRLQGIFEERVRRLRASTFQVSPKIDKSGRCVDLNYDISQGTTTPAQIALIRALDGVIVVVSLVLRRSWHADRRHAYMERLVGVGRVGLMEGNLDLATDNLGSIQADFLARHAPRVKNGYIARLGGWSLLWVVLCALGYVATRRYLEPGPGHGASPDSYEFLGDILWRFRNFFLLAIGAGLGTWLAFMIGRPPLQFTGLVQLDDDLLSPSVRVVFTIVLATVVGLLFWTGIVGMSAGGFSTDLHKAGTPALVVGIFSGLASGVIATAVLGRARDFAAGVAVGQTKAGTGGP